MDGMITNIQRCSVHDGPGIRTTVFVKGCNLRCAWCHNPETISFEPQELFHPEKCIHCGMCAEGCFSGARVICGVRMSVSEVIDEVIKDREYYGSDGGMTVSGGEPTCQWEFTAALLRAAKQEHIGTAIESNLTCTEEHLETVLESCDLVMADIKIFDPEKHRRYTGAGNERILRNMKRVGRPLIVRTPVVCGINDTEDEIGRIAAFAGGLGTLQYYELLPYHPLGLSKGAGEQERFSAPSKERMHALARIAGQYCKEVRIAGRPVEC